MANIPLASKETVRDAWWLAEVPFWKVHSRLTVIHAVMSCIEMHCYDLFWDFTSIRSFSLHNMWFDSASHGNRFFWSVLIWCVHRQLHCSAVCRSLRQWCPCPVSNLAIVLWVLKSENEFFALDCVLSFSGTRRNKHSLSTMMQDETSCSLPPYHFPGLRRERRNKMHGRKHGWQTDILNISCSSRGFCRGCPWDPENCKW